MAYKSTYYSIYYFTFALLFLLTHHLKAQCPDLTSSTISCPTPGTPCTLCEGETVSLNATGNNLPAGTIDWYLSTNPSFTPPQGQFIGSSIITPQIPPCSSGSDCPQLWGILVDACVNPEANNEYMVVFSGGGFAVDDLQVDLDANNNFSGPENDDINTGGSCGWAIPSVVLQNCGTAIPVGPGGYVPPNSIVVIFTSSSSAGNYDFSLACALGLPVYVMMNSCTRSVGAFSNSGGGNRTTTLSLACSACNNSITYDRSALVGGDGAFVLDVDFPFPTPNIYLNNTCAFPSGLPTIPGGPPPNIPSNITQFDYTVTSNLCNNGTYYINGVVNPGSSAPCNTQYTDYFPITVVCPLATPTTIDACSSGFSGAFTDLTTIASTVNGGTGATVSWWENPGATVPVTNPNNAQVPTSGTFYATVSSGGCESDPVPINVNVITTPSNFNTSFTVDPPVACGPTQVNVIFNFPNPGSYQVELLVGSTPWNSTVTANTPYPFNITQGTLFQLLSASDGLCGGTFASPVTNFVDVLSPPNAFPTSISACGDGTTAVFNLQASAIFVNGNTPQPVNWYLDNATQNLITDPTNFSSTSTNIYATVGNPLCPSNVVTIPLTVFDAPTANAASAEACALTGNEATFDLTSLASDIDPSSTGTITFYENSNLTNIINDPNNYSTTSTTIYAVLTAQTCDSDPVDITLNVLASATLNLGTASLCGNQGIYDLTQIQDINYPDGIWSGTNVSGTGFDPAGLTSGTYNLTFTPDDDCVQATATTITVTESLSPTLGTADICEEDGLFDLTSIQDPAIANGTWTGQNVSGTNFNPENLSGVILLTFTPNGTCAQSATTQITVNVGEVELIDDVYCEGQTIDIQTETFDINNPVGTITVNNGSVNGCDLTINVDLTFNENSSADITGSYCDDEIINIAGEDFDSDTPSGTVVIPNYLNCDSTININLTFFPAAESLLNQTLCTGSTIQVGTEIFDETNPSGTVVLENASFQGCDSTVQVNLTFNSEVINDLNPIICTEDNLMVNGMIFDVNTPIGSTTIQNGSFLGCDSTINVSLSFFPVAQGTLNQTLCTGNSIQVGNEIFDETNPNGTVVLENASFQGCDSTIQVSLTFDNEVINNLNPTICAEDNIMVNGMIFDINTPIGSTTIQNGSFLGCDSTINVNLDFFPVAQGTLNQTLCTGNSIQVGSEIFDEANPTGTVILENASFQGCDSTIQVNLSFDSEIINDLNPTICPDANITVNGMIFDINTPSGSTTIENGSFTGCDSTINVNLSFFPVAQGMINQTLCTGSTIQVGSEIFDEANPNGTVILDNASFQGCDSTIQVNLTFDNEVINNLNQTICEEDNIIVNGMIFDVSTPIGSTTIQNGSFLGCDSTINVNLSFFPVAQGMINQTLCTGSTIQVGSEIFNEANPNGTVILENASFQGCDSIIQVNLFFDSEVINDLNPTICPDANITINGMVFDINTPIGSTTIENGSFSGCDSTINVNLSFFPVAQGMINQTLCTGSTIQVGSEIFDEANPNGTVILENASFQGCDSTIQVNLTFNSEIINNLDQTICADDNIIVNGMTFDANTPTGSTTILNGSFLGCDSTINVNLSFFPTASSNFSETFCGGGFLVVGGQTFDENTPSGVVTLEDASFQGCDSTINVSLVFNGESIVDLMPTLCSDEFITINGTIYDIDNPTGTEVIDGGNYLGCDSIINITLDILSDNIETLDFTLNQGEVFELAGVIFDANMPNGTVTIENGSINGCDSIISVNLTFIEELTADFSINPPTCFGDSDGTIVINEVFGGAIPYTLLINGEIVASINSFPFTIGNLSPADYDFQINSGNNGAFITQVTIPSPPSLQVDLGTDQEIFFGDSATIIVNANFAVTQYEWTPFGSLTCQECEMPFAVPAETTTYSLIASDANGCTASDEITINIQAVAPEFAFAPNIFSPNGDGINDLFFIQTNGGIDQISAFQVFDRWGGVMFSIKNIEANMPVNGWDGRTRGEDADEGVYIFFASFILPDGTKEVFKGDVTLIR